MNVPLQASPLSRRTAWAMVVAVIALIVWGLVGASRTPPDAPSGQSDSDLYSAVNARMAGGTGYYAASIAVQQERGYPTAPAAAVRTPVLATVVGALGTTMSQILLSVMLVAAAPLLLHRFETMTARRLERYAAMVLVLASTVIYATPAGIWSHEVWALALIVLSIAVRSDRHWVAAVVLGMAAAFFRELTLVYPGVMLLLALRQQRREAVAWAAGIVGFLAFYAWHIQAVAAAQVPDPPRSQGWLRFGGWPFIVDSMQFGSFLGLAPHAMIAVLAPIALAGWWFVRSPVATRMALTAAAFIICFMVLGRPVNVYWGILYAALLMPGLAFAPRGAREVWRAISAPRRARDPVTR